jgi:hypothetical protein
MDKKKNSDGVTLVDRYDTFRAPGGIGFRTESLFADVIYFKKRHLSEKAPYWLVRNKLGDDRPCFRDWFLHFEDLSGYEVAMKFLGSKEHWDKMYNASEWFRDAVEEWKVELRARLAARAMEAIQAMVTDPDTPPSQRLSAAKFVVDNLTEKPDKRGRPSREVVSGQLKKEIETIKDSDADWERMTGHHGNA